MTSPAPTSVSSASDARRGLALGPRRGVATTAVMTASVMPTGGR